MLDEIDAVHGLGALVATDAPGVVIEMEVPSIVRHMGHGLVEIALERLNGAEALEVWIS